MSTQIHCSVVWRSSGGAVKRQAEWGSLVFTEGMRERQLPSSRQLQEQPQNSWQSERIYMNTDSVPMWNGIHTVCISSQCECLDAHSMCIHMHTVCWCRWKHSIDIATCWWQTLAKCGQKWRKSRLETAVRNRNAWSTKTAIYRDSSSEETLSSSYSETPSKSLLLTLCMCVCTMCVCTMCVYMYACVVCVYIYIYTCVCVCVDCECLCGRVAGKGHRETWWIYTKLFWSATVPLLFCWAF